MEDTDGRIDSLDLVLAKKLQHMKPSFSQLWEILDIVNSLILLISAERSKQKETEREIEKLRRLHGSNENVTVPAQCDQCASEYKRGFDEGYAQGDVSEEGLDRERLESVLRLEKENADRLAWAIRQAPRSSQMQDAINQYENLRKEEAALVDWENSTEQIAEKILCDWEFSITGITIGPEHFRYRKNLISRISKAISDERRNRLRERK